MSSSGGGNSSCNSRNKARSNITVALVILTVVVTVVVMVAIIMKVLMMTMTTITVRSGNISISNSDNAYLVSRHSFRIVVTKVVLTDTDLEIIRRIRSRPACWVQGLGFQPKSLNPRGLRFWAFGSGFQAFSPESYLELHLCTPGCNRHGWAVTTVASILY